MAMLYNKYAQEYDQGICGNYLKVANYSTAC